MRSMCRFKSGFLHQAETPSNYFAVYPQKGISHPFWRWVGMAQRLTRKIMSDFYTSTAWKTKRAAILSRDGYMCRRCKRYGRLRQATTVHHIKHYDEYPELALDNDNLISLCDACHNYFHPEKAQKSNKKRGKFSYF